MGGTGEDDPVLLALLLKLAVDILHPIMASSAVGVVVLVGVVEGIVVLSLRSGAPTCLPPTAELSLEDVVVIAVV